MRVLLVLALLLITLLAMGNVASAEHGSGAGGITPWGAPPTVRQ